MSTEQSEASETSQQSCNPQVETPQQSCNPQVDITQQATTPTPTATPQRVKNPKRVAAGKMVAEKTRLAREQQKKAAAEAAIIIANNKAKATAPVSEPDPPTEYETPKSAKVDNSSLSTTQWIGVAGIVVSLIGIYYKREELKAVFNKKTTHEPERVELQPVRTTLKRGVTQPRGVKHLD